MKVLVISTNNLTKRVTNALIKNGVDVTCRSEESDVANILRKENFDITLIDAYARNVGEIYQSVQFLDRTYVALLISGTPEDQIRIQSLKTEAYTYDEFESPGIVDKLSALVLRRKDRLTKIKVLVVEDEPYIARAINISILRHWPNAELHYTGLGKEGIELARSKQIDVVLLDIRLPDISGIEVLSAIRSSSSVPVIITTANKDQDDIVKSISMGASDYMIKPFKQEDLIYRIRKNIESKPVFGSAPVESQHQ